MRLVLPTPGFPIPGFLGALLAVAMLQAPLLACVHASHTHVGRAWSHFCDHDHADDASAARPHQAGDRPEVDAAGCADPGSCDGRQIHLAEGWLVGTGGSHPGRVVPAHLPPSSGFDDAGRDHEGTALLRPERHRPPRAPTHLSNVLRR